MYATVLTNYEQARLAEVQATSSVVQIGQAGVSYRQVNPKTLLYTLLAGLAGVILAAGIVLARDALDNTIKSADEITRSLKLPVVGVIYKHSSNGQTITQSQPGSPVSDAFRSLRTNLMYADLKKPLRSILITSPTASEAKSKISSNLAVVLAQVGYVVTLIDADFRRPSIHDQFGISNTTGLTNLLGRPNIALEGFLQPTQVEGLSIIPTGPNLLNPTEFLAAPKMATVIKMLVQEGKMVVIDTPPVLPVADAVILATRVDGVLLVLQPGQTTLQATRQAVANFRQVNARIIGVVLNNIDLKASGYYRYYRHT